jgi:hypothetical protein
MGRCGESVFVEYCLIETRPPSSATVISSSDRGIRGASLRRCARSPPRSTRYTCSKYMCPNGSMSSASCRCWPHENRSRVRGTGFGSLPMTGRPSSSATNCVTRALAPAGSIRHGVRRTGRVTARSTEATWASWRRIASYTAIDCGHCSSGVVSMSS